MTSMAPVVLIDNYDSFTYNLYQMLQAQTRREVKVFRHDEIAFGAIADFSPAGVILSPGPGHPEKEADFGVCREAIARQHELGYALLGVCLGFQGIVCHFGGQLESAPVVMHGKISMVEKCADSPLLEGIESPFEVMRYHSWVASSEAFPNELQVVAREPRENVMMALQHRELPIYGVQFHPESIGTACGARMLGNFLSRCMT